MKFTADFENPAHFRRLGPPTNPIRVQMFATKAAKITPEASVVIKITNVR
jgi:hypothetical protein